MLLSISTSYPVAPSASFHVNVMLFSVETALTVKGVAGSVQTLIVLLHSPVPPAFLPLTLYV